jgi:hypothetical protein
MRQDQQHPEVAGVMEPVLAFPCFSLIRHAYSPHRNFIHQGLNFSARPGETLRRTPERQIRTRRTHGRQGKQGRRLGPVGLLFDGMTIMAGGFGLCGIPEI